MRKKIVFLPYDMDTAIGINNEGALVFSYNLEDTDQTEGGADVFNGQQSVLWKNMRAAFFDEMKAMYQTLRSTGALSYDKVERMFEEHQGKWPEAVFNEDAWYKYLAPLVEKGNASYLSMLQGSKAEQRKWWLYNRFRYIDSKYNAGDALSDVITVRGYAKADITVEPYADVYASIKYGSYLVQARSARNTQTTLPCPLDNVNDTEIYIYSASQLASVGDLSGLKVGYADFSKAVKLQALKIGDASAGYSNGNLTELYLGNNELLRTIDIRNCPMLSQAVDISGCSNIEHVFFDGTAITALDLPKGGIIKTLHLPGTVTNLTVIGHPGITDFVLPSISQISTLRLENNGTALDSIAIINQLNASSRVRVIGFTWPVEDEDEITDMLDVLDTMRGLNENGGNEEKAQMLGTFVIDTVSGAVLLDVKNRYSDISVSYTHVNSLCYFYNWDGTELLYTAESSDGANVEYDGSTPEKPDTVSLTFTFAGWSRIMGSDTVQDDAMRTVIEDRTLYPVFTDAIRTFTVRYYSDNVLLQTIPNVPYGTEAPYTGATPVKRDVSDPTEYDFIGWDLSAAFVRTDMDIHAQFNYTGYTYRHILDGTLDGTYVNNRVTSVANRAFWGLNKVVEIQMDNLLIVPESCFNDCSKLKRLSIANATQIKNQAFKGASVLDEVIAPKVSTLDGSAFSNSGIKSITLPKLTSMGTYCFQRAKRLEEIHFAILTSTNQLVFDGCTNLKIIDMPKIVSIADNSFNGCTALEEVDLPSTLRNLGSYAFANATSLRSVIIRSTTMNYMPNTVFNKCTNLTDIYVGWAEGAVSGAPWGATNATIHYGGNWEV